MASAILWCRRGRFAIRIGRRFWLAADLSIGKITIILKNPARETHRQPGCILGAAPTASIGGGGDDRDRFAFQGKGGPMILCSLDVNIKWFDKELILLGDPVTLRLVAGC